jgi:hypothetical protein
VAEGALEVIYRARYLAALCRVTAHIERVSEDHLAAMRAEVSAARERVNRSAGQHARRSRDEFKRAVDGMSGE